MKHFYNHKFVIKICILIIFLTIDINSLHLQQQHRRQISKQCCLMRGGFQCGSTLKQCCVVPQNIPKEKINSELCVKGGLFSLSEYCPGDKITQQCDYCHSQCEAKKGIICGLPNGQQDVCCLQENCIPDINFELKMKKCKPGTQIQLKNCVIDMSLADQVFGKVGTII